MRAHGNHIKTRRPAGASCPQHHFSSANTYTAVGN